MKKSPFLLAAALAFFAALPVAVSAQTPRLLNVTNKPVLELNIWPGAAPGEKGDIGPERVLPERPRPFDQIDNVSVPTLMVFQPEASKRTGTGVLVIPGGGLARLALETEGYEAAQWFNDQGITAFVLKYRVPARSGGPRYLAGLQDAQRAMGIIRSRAAEWGVDADAIGSIGYSAGAEINIMLSVYHADARMYPEVDAADKFSTRPDFNIPIYGGGFTTQTALREDIQTRLNKSTPPMFIVHAFDDNAQSSITLMAALKRANIPSELHIFAAGGHGFGMRDTGLPVGAWRDQLVAWLRWQGFLDPVGVRSFARDYFANKNDPAKRPAFSAVNRNATMQQAFAAQRRLVNAEIKAGAAVAGYKGGFTTAASQSTNKLKAPAHAVLYKAGRIDAKAGENVPVKGNPSLLVETEIGYVMATDIGTKLRVPRQAATTVEAIVPVIELPNNPGEFRRGALVMNPLDAVAANIGSNQYIVGPRVATKDIANTDTVAVTLTRDGKEVHKTTGADVKGGQTQMLMDLINQIIDQGHVIRAGDIIITGALAGAKPAEKGKYTADYGTLGKVEFTVE